MHNETNNFRHIHHIYHAFSCCISSVQLKVLKDAIACDVLLIKTFMAPEFF